MRRTNLGPKAKPMVARLWDDGKVVWSVQEEPAEKVGPTEAAKRWPAGFLEAKTMSANEVLAAGHARRTLERAKAELGYRSGWEVIEGKREWMWYGSR